MNHQSAANSSRSASLGKMAVMLIILIGVFAWFSINNINRIRKYQVSGEVGWLGDFGHFYGAAVAMAHHEDIYASWKQGYIYPPLIAFLYLPLAPLTVTQAAYVLLIVNIGLIISAVWIASKEFLDRMGAPRHRLAVLSVMVIAILLDVDKIKGELQMWQTNGLVLMMFALALRWLDRKPLLAGAALGVIMNIKYLSIGMLPYLLLRRRWAAAASMVAGTILFAILPATVSGWERNNRDLRVAVGGLLHMTGAEGDRETAKVEDIKNALSCSITSALARATAYTGSSRLALAGTAAIAGISVGLACWMYRRNGMPILKWPDSRAQQAQPYRTLIGIEWAALISFALVFSPQTNTRHLVDVLLMAACIGAMVLYPARGVARWPIIAGVLLLMAGFYLPPGRRDVAWLRDSLEWWIVHGGPCLCLLGTTLAVIWTGLRQARALKGIDATVR